MNQGITLSKKHSLRSDQLQGALGTPVCTGGDEVEGWGTQFVETPWLDWSNSVM